MGERVNSLSRLLLPRRWELLAEQAEAAQVDPSVMVERVDDAAERVDSLLRRVRDGGGGAIEVIYGLSGSGKTTFLQTLPLFFESVRVTTFPSETPITALPEFIKKDYIKNDQRGRILLIDRRDNPTSSELDQVEEMFGRLLNVFREPEGAAVVLWPITKPESARKIADTAWTVGRDSMTDTVTSGQFGFKGVKPEKYWDLADNTSRTLTGDGLEAYGILPEAGATLLPNCDTISDFFSLVTNLADEQRDETWSVLKTRFVAHLWVLLPGDNVTLVNATADSLTQGTKSKIDIDKIGEFIDLPDSKSIYVSDWRNRRGKLAHLLRAIDVRLFGFPPNVSLAAIRSFGDQTLKSRLNQPTTSLESSKSAMRASRLYKAIIAEAGLKTTPYAGARRISKETGEEYVRAQSAASKDDKPLNKALGSLIAACLKDDAPDLAVISEKKTLPGSTLQPDIQIVMPSGEIICLEPTWRRSGTVEIEGHPKPSQNTLSEAHLKKYVLEKATQYVKDLGL